MCLDFTLLALYLLIFSYYVYCYPPKYRGKFLVCENVLGSKPDSDYTCVWKNVNRNLQSC